ncbi:MAG TPA: class I SAM-dependent methyltransferase [Terriglobales bacterium]|nr:class I SAM-dependent methyltransferase [Terriglobales bacterium]
MPLENARPHPGELFDRYSSEYESTLDRALAPSGESARYFARRRVEWLQNQLQAIGSTPHSVLDFGCGTGGSIPFLKEILFPHHLVGVDISSKCLLRARQTYAHAEVEFANCRDFAPHAEFDLAFCNGVFHHIAPGARAAAMRYVFDSLVPGGLFAFWENNPWNPATTYLMRRCEFDEQALPISRSEATRLLRDNGFSVVHSSSLFYFPRWLKWLRGMEPVLSRLPLGAQYFLLARKPA